MQALFTSSLYCIYAYIAQATKPCSYITFKIH